MNININIVKKNSLIFQKSKYFKNKREVYKKNSLKKMLKYFKEIIETMKILKYLEKKNKEIHVQSS